MTIEICVEDLAQSLAAERGGADRLELCAGLSEGGLTPSYGMASLVADGCSLPVYAMVRPRGGSFVYSASELTAMHRDVEAMARAGARGVVLGCLTPAGHLDLTSTEGLVRRAREAGLGVTFHRAIDVCQAPLEVLLALADMGVEQVLTSGGARQAEKGHALIAEMVKVADGRIAVMAGSGVHPGNASRIAATGVQALHCTARRAGAGDDPLGFGVDWLPDEDKVRGVVDAVKR